MTRKRKYEGVRWSLSRSSLAVRCAGVSAFSLSHRRRSQSCSYHDYALHCSHERGMAAWQHGARATYQYHVNGMDTVGWSVGWSVDARGPVDHDSVGLAQARPNYCCSCTAVK